MVGVRPAGGKRRRDPLPYHWNVPNARPGQVAAPLLRALSIECLWAARAISLAVAAPESTSGDAGLREGKRSSSAAGSSPRLPCLSGVVPRDSATQGHFAIRRCRGPLSSAFRPRSARVRFQWWRPDLWGDQAAGRLVRGPRGTALERQTILRHVPPAGAREDWADSILLLHGQWRNCLSVACHADPVLLGFCDPRRQPAA